MTNDSGAQPSKTATPEGEPTALAHCQEVIAAQALEIAQLR